MLTTPLAAQAGLKSVAIKCIFSFGSVKSSAEIGLKALSTSRSEFKDAFSDEILKSLQGLNEYDYKLGILKVIVENFIIGANRSVEILDQMMLQAADPLDRLVIFKGRLGFQKPASKAGSNPLPDEIMKLLLQDFDRGSELSRQQFLVTLPSAPLTGEQQGWILSRLYPMMATESDMNRVLAAINILVETHRVTAELLAIILPAGPTPWAKLASMAPSDLFSAELLRAYAFLYLKQFLASDASAQQRILGLITEASRTPTGPIAEFFKKYPI